MLTSLRRAILRIAPGLSRAAAAQRQMGSLRREVAPLAPSFEFVQYGSSDIEVAIAEPAVSPKLAGLLRSGSYEASEARLATRLVRRGDVVVELGAGVGVVSTAIMQTGKAKSIHCFEADARLIALIHATHQRNGVTGEVYNAAITADSKALRLGYIDFHLRQNFYASSIDGRSTEESVRVPACSLSRIARALRPTLLLVDIEGAEDGLFRRAQIPSVQRIALEVHHRALGGDGIRRLFRDLHRLGFHYDPAHSAGKVPVFSRG